MNKIEDIKIGNNINLFNGDCLEVMDKLISDGVVVDAIITSPPYDDIKNYNNTLNWNLEVFKEVANRLYKILKDGGVIIWVVGDKTKNGSESLTSFKQAIYFNQIGFNLHDTMIYRKLAYTPLTHNRYEQEFEYMFCFSKGKPKTFNPIKIPCKWAGTETWGEATTYKDNSDNLVNIGRKTISENKIKGNIFEYSPMKMKAQKIKHPAMFPPELAEDMINSWTNIDDIILDPFMGSGTTGVACKNLNRNFIGIELDEGYFNIAKERIEKVRGETI